MSVLEFSQLRREARRMSKLSNAVSLHPYFQIREGNLEKFLDLMPKFVEKTSTEPACLYPKEENEMIAQSPQVL